jgi:hypothetical protein
MKTLINVINLIAAICILVAVSGALHALWTCDIDLLGKISATAVIVFLVMVIIRSCVNDTKDENNHY